MTALRLVLISAYHGTRIDFIIVLATVNHIELKRFGRRGCKPPIGSGVSREPSVFLFIWK